jgi:plasmid stabilization system protein ParE
MGQAVIFSAQANRDLGDIVAFLALKNPPAAERLGHALVDRCISLGAMPRIGPSLHDRPEVRRIFHKPLFIIYYRISACDSVIEIARIWDARQNPETLRLSS